MAKQITQFNININGNETVKTAMKKSVKTILITLATAWFATRLASGADKSKDQPTPEDLANSNNKVLLKDLGIRKKAARKEGD